MLEDYEGSRAEFMKLLAEREEPPAFVQRAQRVEAAWEWLVRQCSRQRHELLEMPRMRLATVAAVIGQQWTSLSCCVGVRDDIDYLRELHEQWQPKLRVQISPASAPRKIHATVRDLCESFKRFNRRWEAQVAEVNLAGVNYERQAYNEFYIVEKAAALGSERLASHGFEPLTDKTAEDLMGELPSLRIPQLRSV